MDLFSLQHTVDRAAVGGFRNYIKSIAAGASLSGYILRTRGTYVEVTLFGLESSHDQFEDHLTYLQEISLISDFKSFQLRLPPRFVQPHDITIKKNESKFAVRGAFSHEYADLDCRSE
jgi:acylphosphatase